ncbi:hypothetical protein QTO34_001248, partial [Cnephaeus nilssonii]
MPRESGFLTGNRVTMVSKLCRFSGKGLKLQRRLSVLRLECIEPNCRPLRGARPHLDSGRAASPGSGTQHHPGPGARGLTRTQGRVVSPGPSRVWVPHVSPKTEFQSDLELVSLRVEEKPRTQSPTSSLIRASTFTWLPAAVFRQQQFSSGHPLIRAPPASLIGYPGRNSDPGGAPIGGWPEENWCWRKTAASSHAIGHHQRLPPAPWVLPQRWPNGRWEERESGTRESPPPAPTASQSATLSPAPAPPAGPI